MSSPFGDIELPALIGVNVETNTYKAVRRLVEKDLAGLEKARNTYDVANPIMAMFGVLYLNHQDLMVFTASLPSQPARSPDPVLNANRLILNYVAAADALLEHFLRTYKKQCRLWVLSDTGFKDFLIELAKKDDDFQFFTMFRNHVLHAGLPVGAFTQSDSVDKGKNWSITYSAADLLKDPRGEWKRCRILQKDSTVNIIACLERYHQTMMTTVFRTIVSYFRSALDSAHQFHLTMTKEVQQIDPSLRPCILTTNNSNGLEFQVTFDVLPVDLFAALGIEMNLGQDH